MASEKKITMREYNGTDYDTLYPKTIAEQVDGVYSKEDVLSNDTKSLFGLGTDAVPNDALALLSRFPNGLGNDYLWEKYIKRQSDTHTEISKGSNADFFSVSSSSSTSRKIYYGDSYTVNSDGTVTLVNQKILTLTESQFSVAKLSVLVGKWFYSTMDGRLNKICNFIPENSTITLTVRGSYNEFFSSKGWIQRTDFSPYTVKENFSYVNSSNPNAYPPAVSDGYTYTALGQIGAKANITTGKYTGTGTYGNTKLNSLTFSFFPKAIFIIPVATSMNSYSGQFGAFLYGAAMCSTRLDGGGGSTQCNVTITGWGTNTIKWFGASSDYQLNMSNKEYRYVAIG